MPPPIPLYPDDIVQMRKPHPCGGDTWRIVRVGADVGLRCLTCNRHVLLQRSTFERRLRHFVQRGPAAPSAESV